MLPAAKKSRYVYVSVVEDGCRQSKRLHRHIAELALGHKLPIAAVVHHIDGNPENNANDNLVICENEDYHRLLHERADALAGCGNPDFRQCVRCKEWCDTAGMESVGRRSWIHPEPGRNGWYAPPRPPRASKRRIVDKRGREVRFGAWCRNLASRAVRTPCVLAQSASIFKVDSGDA